MLNPSLGNMAAKKTFDYIIIGAGSAGNTLAARLTEDAGVTVLLLEAGGPDGIITLSPNRTSMIARSIGRAVKCLGAHRPSTA